jgi:predicted alpha/beta hydrolase
MKTPTRAAPTRVASAPVLPTPSLPGPPRPFTFHTADQTPLVGHFFQAQGAPPTPPTRVLIAGALGVPQRFYFAFAHWLAQRGCEVMSFDLRGMGASRLPLHAKSLRGLDADLLTWARQDFAAAVVHLVQRASNTSFVSSPICVVGHSLGAHHAVMTTNNTQALISRVVSVAAGAGYWRDWAAPSRRKAPWMVHAAVPLLVPVLGYFPGKRLGMVGDLPGPAALQWARWCRHPEFAWGTEPALVRPSLSSARFSVQALSFSDDEAITPACTQKLLAVLPNAPSQLHVVTPASAGLPRIGHLGAFKPPAAPQLWPLIEQLLLKDLAR